MKKTLQNGTQRRRSCFRQRPSHILPQKLIHFKIKLINVKLCKHIKLYCSLPFLKILPCGQASPETYCSIYIKLYCKQSNK